VFLLLNELASGNSLPKWSLCCQLGIHLGPSLNHAWNVYLVLNPITQLVSPQYHCRFDNFFKSVRHQGPEVNISTTWQQLLGLARADAPLAEKIRENVPQPSALVQGSKTIEHDTNLAEQTILVQDTNKLFRNYTTEEEPIANQTRGSLRSRDFACLVNMHPAAHEAIMEEDLGESTAD
jgi:hypothetical protein